MRKRVENGTYDGDPSRSARFKHGSGALLGAAAGSALWGAGLLALRLLGLLP